ncbi:MAG: hypothetical protein AAB560_02250 [Patescibacteria group bacterium]
MSLKFEFIIDKGANFAYWAQLLLGSWSWYFEKENSQLFLEEMGTFSKEEQKALEKLRMILQKKGNQYRWLWQRYGNQPFDNGQDEEVYNLIKSAFDQKFQLLWNKESPSLKQWKTELERYNFEKLLPAFRNIAIFLGLAENLDLTHPKIKLLISGNFPTGATRADFKNLIILNVSRVPLIKISRAAGVLIHECAHLLNNEGGFMNKLIEAADYPNIKVDGGYKWKYLIGETVLKSVSSHRANTYIGKLLDFSDSERKNDEDLSHKLPLREYGYEFLIRIAASRLFPETIAYIEAGKVIDQMHINNAVNILADLLREREAV